MTRVLAVRGGHDGDAEVDGAAGDAQLEAAVLRHALLGDVELRHDLDAADDRGVMALVDRLERFVEHAVDAVLDDHLVVARLDVDVRGAALDGVEDDGVDQLDDRRRLLLRDRVDRQRLFALFVLADELHAEAFGGFVEHALRRLRLLQLVADRGGRGHLDLQRRAEEQLQLVELEHVGRIADHDGDVPVLAPLRQELVADHQVERDVAEELVIDLEVLQVDEREAVLLGHALRARRFAGESAFLEGAGIDAIVVVSAVPVAGSWAYSCLTADDYIIAAPRRQLEQRKIKGVEQNGDDDAHEHEDDRLDRRHQPGQSGFDFLIVELADIARAFPSARRSIRRP